MYFDGHPSSDTKQCLSLLMFKQAGSKMMHITIFRHRQGPTYLNILIKHYLQVCLIGNKRLPVTRFFHIVGRQLLMLIIVAKQPRVRRVFHRISLRMTSAYMYTTIHTITWIVNR